MINRLLRYFFAGVLILSATGLSCSADSSISVRHNGISVTPPAPPIIEDGRTLLPVRTAFEMVGLDVAWRPETQTAIGYHGDYQIALQIGSKTVSVNDEIIALEIPARIISDRVYVPLRFVSETLGADVTWDEKNRIVNVYTNHLKTKVFFKEPTLKEAIYELVNKPISEDLTRGDLIYLTNVDLSNEGITTLEEIEYLENLKTLNLEGNQIRNLDPLKKLAKLRHLDLSDNLIEDIQPLGALPRLSFVDLKNNDINSIQTLFRWSNIKEVQLAGNRLDTPEDLSPLYYLKDRIVCDLNLTSVDEPARNTWNLRSDALAYRVEVSPNLFWIPAINAGESSFKNEDLPTLIGNTPTGKASKIKTVYDLLQYLQHEDYTVSESDKQVQDSASQRQWIYPKPAGQMLSTMSGTSRALANAAAYLLYNDYDDSGILVLIDKNGKETIFNYIREDRSVKEENEEEEEVTRRYTEYTVFNLKSYLKDSQNPAAPEDGFLPTYKDFGGITSNIHLTEDLTTFVKAYAGIDNVAVAYAISYVGNEKAFFPTSTYPVIIGTGSQFLYLPKRAVIENSDDDEYNSNPIESYYRIIYDDPSDKFSIRWSENNSVIPTWNRGE